MATSRVITFLGGMAMRPIVSIGQYTMFLGESVRRMAIPPVSFVLLAKQLEFVGNKSFGVAIIAGLMVGGIFGFQLGEIFRIFGAESMIGAAAGFTLSKELAPVVGSMLVTGRAGSAM